jgi:hypothetical protein
MVLSRFVDALREDFPLVEAVLGHDAFIGLVERYVRRHPSEDPNLGKLGKKLPAYLRETAALNGARPDLGDLAELEWARSMVFETEECEPSGQEALAALSPEELVAARLVLMPSVTLLSFEHSVTSLWEALREDENASPDPIAEPEHVAVWRDGFDVYHVAVDPEEALALERVIAGESMAEVCSLFSSADQAFPTIGSWFLDGWIRSVEVPEVG